MEMDEDFMEKKVAFRLHYGFRMPVVSGYRCDAHYEKVNPNSRYKPHKGHATDSEITLIDAGRIINPRPTDPTLKEFGFTGMGLRKSRNRGYVILHLDDVQRGHDFIAWGY